MIRVHHLEKSRSVRVLWLLEELGLEYELVTYKRVKGTFAPPSLKAIHPLGKSPLVEHNGRVLAESGAIIEELIERYAPATLAPERGTDVYWRYIYWLHYGEGSAMPPLFLRLVLTKMGPLGWPAKPYAESEIALHLDYWEGELGKARYFAGDSFTGADIQMFLPIDALVARRKLEKSHPRLVRFDEEMRARPAYRRAEARGGSIHGR